jgi:hypothetical protein
MAAMFRIGLYDREPCHTSNVEKATDIPAGSYPSIMYAKEGQGIKERLWEETMEELNFAGASKIVQDMRS